MVQSVITNHKSGGTASQISMFAVLRSLTDLLILRTLSFLCVFVYASLFIEAVAERAK